MNAFSRSWELTKLTFDVMKKDKKLFLFPLIGGIFSILFIIAMVLPFVVKDAFSEAGIASSGLGFYGWIFILYLGLAFIATFFNVCTVYTIRQTFDGKHAKFGDAIKFAFSRIHLIFMWAIISATVGLILRILDDIAERMGGIGEIIMKIFISMLGAAWAIITAFVIPGMVYENIGPFKAFKRSIQTVRKTWGESLTRYYGLGFVEFIFILIGVIMTIVLAVVGAVVSPVLMWIFIIAGCLYLLAVVLVFSIANNVFNTALYVYANTGKAPKGYRHDILAETFKKNKDKE